MQRFQEMIPTLAILLGFLAILGLPIFITILGAAMLGLTANLVEISAIPIEIFRLANSPVLLAIPLFTFAGYLLSEGGTGLNCLPLSLRMRKSRTTEGLFLDGYLED